VCLCGPRTRCYECGKASKQALASRDALFTGVPACEKLFECTRAPSEDGVAGHMAAATATAAFTKLLQKLAPLEPADDIARQALITRYAHVAKVPIATVIAELQAAGAAVTAWGQHDLDDFVIDPSAEDDHAARSAVIKHYHEREVEVPNEPDGALYAMRPQPQAVGDAKRELLLEQLRLRSQGENRDRHGESAPPPALLDDHCVPPALPACTALTPPSQAGDVINAGDLAALTADVMRRLPDHTKASIGGSVATTSASKRARADEGEPSSAVHHVTSRRSAIYRPSLAHDGASTSGGAAGDACGPAAE